MVNQMGGELLIGLGHEAILAAEAMKKSQRACALWLHTRR